MGRNSPLVYEAIDILFDANVDPEAVRIFTEGLKESDDPVKLANLYVKSRGKGWRKGRKGGD